MTDEAPSPDAEPEDTPAGVVDWSTKPYPWNELGPEFRAQVLAICTSGEA